MKIVEILIGNQDCRSCNLSTFSPIKIGNYSCRISLQPLKEREDGLNWNSIHSCCNLGKFDGVNN